VCYEPTARPPLPPIAGGAGPASGTDIVLRATDGTRLAAFSALSSSGTNGPAIVILPDVRGLHDFYRHLATRFAEAGIHATAFDYFGRTAGIGTPEMRGEEFDYRQHVQQTTPETIALDTAAAVAHVRSAEGGGAEAVFTVGFCFGGRNSFNQAARGLGLAGVVGFFGVPQQRGADDTNAPVVVAPSYACPVLGLFGGADHAIARSDIEAFRQALDSAGVPNELVVYDGAPHSFFDRTFAEYRKESEDAWNRMLRFIRDRP